ncbi:MAG: error-prone DNA polymerase [Micrococcales bacterium]|nr:error-prone DNA polymerase [Micrococcales bacterium]
MTERYAELHAHSAFSFLDGASQPEELANRAAELGIETMALTDHHGLYGVVQFTQAARKVGLATCYGAELLVDDAAHLLILARGPLGYTRLSAAIGRANLALGQPTGGPAQAGLGLQLPDEGGLAAPPAGARPAPGRLTQNSPPAQTGLDSQLPDEGGLVAPPADARPAPGRLTQNSPPAQADVHQPPTFQLEDLAAAGGGEWLVLTGCRQGQVRRALEGADPRQPANWDLVAAQAEAERLAALFGQDNVAVEITQAGDPFDPARCQALAQVAKNAKLPLVATGNIHYASPGQFQLATAMAALKQRQSLEQMDGFLTAAPTYHLRTPKDMADRHRTHPEAVAMAAALGQECAFDLRLIAPKLPPAQVPDGHSDASWLRHLALQGARERYGPPGQGNTKAYTVIEHELAIITQMDLAGYFLIMWEIVEFCRRENILCQGRGSAANSAVCYALGITAVDAVHHGLLFERFLAPEREGYPDIDLDIESSRREEVIQHVYTKYGRERAALVGAVISYRSRLALRDSGRALGYGVGQLDAWSKRLERWGNLRRGQAIVQPWGKADAKPEVSDDDLSDIPNSVLDLAEQFIHLPRHLGIHPGGMVLCDRPVIEVCPVQWGRMADRTVLQWDKDCAAAAGLVKFDLLGLGMLGAVHLAFDEIERTEGQRWQMHTIPPESPEVYDLLCAADTVGVFQVESRAQMATLPRLRPRRFYDLVVEVALIRPGPIQGGSVHPYIDRVRGREPVSFDHDLLRPALTRTLGVPLFQEQLMQIAIDAAGFTPSQADELRRAMGAKRSIQKMEALKQALLDGMAAKGINDPAVRDRIWTRLRGFADFGFPESHSFSFALIVYVSAWLKVFHPAAFYAAILASQPMGFYSPQSLVADARRHGVLTNGPDVALSGVQATVELLDTVESEPPVRPPAGHIGPHAGLVLGDRRFGVRLGLAEVRGVGSAAATRIVAARGDGFTSIDDLAHRADLTTAHLEGLATAGALDALAGGRRQALWAAGAVSGAGTLPGTAVGVNAPPLPTMTRAELAAADFWSTGVTLGEHPVAHVRQALSAAEVVPLAQVQYLDGGSWIKVAGVVTHRQRPGTGRGVTFLTLEDETGQMNIVCTADVWNKYRKVGRGASALMVTGRLEKQDDAIGLKAGHLHPLRLPVPAKSRDFQ